MMPDEPIVLVQTLREIDQWSARSTDAGGPRTLQGPTEEQDKLTTYMRTIHAVNVADTRFRRVQTQLYTIWRRVTQLNEWLNEINSGLGNVGN